MFTLPQTMKGLTQLLSCLLLGAAASASAPITFRATDVPRQIGADYWRAHVDASGKDVRALLGAKGGPHRWDFSYAPAAGEDVHRMDVVAPDDGGNGAGFPQAAYAERVTRTGDDCQSWSYYKVIAGAGRWYSGFHDGCKAPQPTVVFDTPTPDLPDNITFGKTWRREVDWRDTIDAGFMVLEVAVHFTNESAVDAYGTVVLPDIGEVPALRVNEVNTYVTTDLTFGIPIDTQVLRNYVWLVPGIGKAVHLISPAGVSVPSENFPTARTVLRVFESSRNRPPECQSVRNLQISLQGQTVFLAWDRDTGPRTYRIESCGVLSASPSWELVLETKDALRFLAVDRGTEAKFFRVMGCQ